MILITGGTGQIGRHLVQELKNHKIPFKVMVRREEARASLEAKGIKAVLGDFTQPGSYIPALAGIQEIFLLSTLHPDLVGQEGAFLTAAGQAGVRRVVRLSAIGANPASSSPLLSVHGLCEARLEGSGLSWTILRPTMFMQNLVPMYGNSVATTATFYAPAGAARIPFVDTRDVAAVAAAILTTPGHDRLVYDITGPELITYEGIAELLSSQVGRTIKFVDVPDDTVYQSMTDMGATPWFAHGIITLFHQFRANAGTAVVTGTVPRLTGKPARTLAAYLQENIHAFRSPKAGAAAPTAGPPAARSLTRKA